MAYNFPGYPSTFFGGGYEVYVGAPIDTMAYRQAIMNCGARVVPELEMISAVNWLGDGDLELSVRVTNGIPVNAAPSAPSEPTGDQLVIIEEPHLYQTGSSDADGDNLYYGWDWGEGGEIEWLGPFMADENGSATHIWLVDGIYDVRVKVRDKFFAETDWSPSLTVEVVPTCCEVPGDINDSGMGPDISDLVYLVTYMFSLGPPPPCMATTDINGSGWGPDISDLVYLVSYMFSGGPPPAPCQ